MKQILALLVVIALISGILTCTQLPSDTSFAPVNFKPTISVPLAPDIYITEGQTLSLAVGVIGTEPFRYAWYKNNVALSNNTDSVLTIPTVPLSTGGTYSVIITNDFGQDTSQAIVTVDSLFYTINISHSGQGTISPAGTNGSIKVRPLATPAFTFVPDSGSFVDTVFVNSAKITASSPYTFSPITTNCTFRVAFAVKQFTTIIFDRNDAGASGAMSSQIFASGTSANLTTNGFTKAGWIFAGWATSSTGAVVYTDGANYASSGSSTVTLYAKWTAGAFTITFDKNDASATGTMASQTITSDSTAPLVINEFVKAGWTFAGWATSSAGSVTYVDGANFTMGPANLTLFAKWTQNSSYTITFDKNDASATGTMQGQSMVSGTSANLSLIGFTKASWNFAGWSTTTTGNVAYSDGASYVMGSANVTLYAKWTQNALYTVTFNKNDAAATGTMFNQSIVGGSSVNLTANAFSKQGWSFAGWATSANGAVVYTDGASYAMGTANVTLFAKWTANQLSIVFDKNDANATGTMANQSIVSGASANLSANGFTKPGFTFAGWATTSSGAVVYADNASYLIGTTNMTLYAKWTANQISITFDKNDAGATGVMANQAITSGAAANLTANAFAKSGYTFAGWATSSTGVVVYTDGATFTMGAAGITLFAKWTQNTLHSITFAKNDANATGTMTSQTIASGASANLTANAFTKPGYTFTGWSTSSVGGVVYTDGASYTIGTADVILYAKWTQNSLFTITFNKNDAAAAGAIADQSIASGASANLTPNGFVKTGWTFAGWATSASGSVVYSNNSSYTMGTANTTLYAVWTQNPVYTITFDKNDGNATGTMTPQSIVGNSSVNLTVNSYVKPGWIFAGWSTTSTSAITLADGATFAMGTANVTLYAHWTANSYSISFSANDGSATGTMANQTIVSESSANLTFIGFTKAGWTFTGWALSPSGVVAYADGASYTMGTGNVTLYAKWTAIIYEITFDKNDPAATGTMNNQSLSSGASANLSTNGYLKTGWTFSGWATTLTGAVIYADAASYTMGVGNVTLYAKWTANLYNVVFYANDANATGTMANQSIASGSSATLTANGFTKPGWSFSGWATSSSGAVVYANGASLTMGIANVNLYAVWTIISYTVTYNLNGGSGTVPSFVTQNYQTTFPVAGQGSMSKPDYQFAGWNTVSDGSGTSYPTGSNYTIGSSNVALYAKWAALKDVDGNVYTTVTIGTQTWMVENLKTTKYNDGTAIPLVTDNTAWSNLTTPGYCWYNNDVGTYKNTYGALYNSYTVNTDKLAPTGWHVATDAEWSTLTTYLGGEGVAGGKLKESGTTHWTSPNTGATNEWGFTALPGGCRFGIVGFFDDIGDNSRLWSATVVGVVGSWARYMDYDNAGVHRVEYPKYYGFQVRCVRD